MLAGICWKRVCEAVVRLGETSFSVLLSNIGQSNLMTLDDNALLVIGDQQKRLEAPPRDNWIFTLGQ